MLGPRHSAPPQAAPLLALASASFLLLIFLAGLMRLGMPMLGFYAVPADAVFVMTAALWIAALVSGQARFEWHPFFGLILFYFAALALSAAFSPAPARALAKLATQAYLLSLPVLAYNLLAGEAALRRAILAWLAATFAIGAAGLVVFVLFYADRDNFLLRHTLFHFGSLPPGNYPRLSLSFGNASMLCNYLTVSAAMLLIARASGMLRPALFGFGLAATLFAAAFTVSPGIGGLLLLLGGAGWAAWRRSHRLLAWAALAAGGLGAVAFLLAAAIAPLPHPTAPFQIEVPLLGTLFPSGRLMLWIDAAETFLRNPLFGAGLGQRSAEVFLLDPSGRRQFLTDAHNSYLNVAAQAGLPGLLALVAITLWIARRTGPLPRPERRTRDAARLGLGAAFLAAFVYGGLTGSFEDARHLWVLIGLFLVAERQDPEPSSSPS